MRQLKISHKVTNRDSQSFNLYLKDIYEIDILTKEEEKILTEKSSKGDANAREELVHRNLRFVVSVAKKYETSRLPIEDLINEGNIGLIIAAQKFRPEMNFRFISYAVWWVRKVILEYISKNGKTVRIPANKINSLSRLDKRTHELEQKLGREVDIQEVMDYYGEEFIGDDISLLDSLAKSGTDSLDREITHDDGNGTTLAELIADDSTIKATDHLIHDINIKDEILRVLNTLKPRDKRIMIALFGLDGNVPMTLKEVGDEIGVTREMIRQIKERNLTNLKKNLANSTLKAYL